MPETFWEGFWFFFHLFANIATPEPSNKDWLTSTELIQAAIARGEPIIRKD